MKPLHVKLQFYIEDWKGVVFILCLIALVIGGGITLQLLLCG